MPHLTIQGSTFHYLEQGTGPALVLLHGFPLDARMWRHQISGLSDAYRVIAPDLRGFGQSRSGDSFTMDSLAADVRAILKQLGALPCVLGGLSMGGYVTLAYAKMCPTDLKAIILMDTKAEADTPEAREGRKKMIQSVHSAGSPGVADAMLPKLLALAYQNSPLAGEVRQMAEQCPPGTLVNALGALRDRPDRTDDLASIAESVLVIVGDQDAITPPQIAREMHGRIPNAQLEIIPNAGHMSPMENPDAVNAAIRKFLGRVSGQ